MTDDDDILAAEYALGLLDAAEMAAVDTRFAGDSALALRVAWWRDQLSPLAGEAAAEPPHDLWPRIARRLAANDDRPLRVAMERWRAAAIGFGAIAALLIGVMTLRPVTPEVVPSAPLVASIVGANGAVVTVSFDATRRRMKIMPGTLDAGKGDVELWLIPEGAKAPLSMGVIDAHGMAVHDMPVDQAVLIHAGGTFAISLEPKGGSPTGQPTGPVVASGKIINA